MVRHHLFWSAVIGYGLMENSVGVLHISVSEHAISRDESGGIIFEEDDMLMCFFEPVRVPETVAESSLVAHPGSSSLFMWFVFHQSLLFEDSMDPVMTNMNVLFGEDLLQGDCCERMLFAYR